MPWGLLPGTSSSLCGIPESLDAPIWVVYKSAHPQSSIATDFQPWIEHTVFDLWLVESVDVKLGDNRRPTVLVYLSKRHPYMNGPRGSNHVVLRVNCILLLLFHFVIIVNLLLYLIYKLNYPKYVCVGKKCVIYRVWYYPQFQASTGVLGMDLLWIRGHHFREKCIHLRVIWTWWVSSGWQVIVIVTLKSQDSFEWLLRCCQDEWCFFCRGEIHFSNLLFTNGVLCYTFQTFIIYRYFIPLKQVAMKYFQS